MKKIRSKLLVMALTFILIVGMLPFGAFAENDPPATGTDLAIENMDGKEEGAAGEGASPSDPGELPGSGEEKDQDDKQGGEEKNIEEKTAESTPTSEPGELPGSGEEKDQDDKQGGEEKTGEEKNVEEKSAESTPIPEPGKAPAKKAAPASNNWVEPPSTPPTTPPAQDPPGSNEPVNSGPSGETGEGGNGAGIPGGNTGGPGGLPGHGENNNDPGTAAYAVTLVAEPAEGGTVTVPNGGTVPAGQSVTVTATANEGYAFNGWYDGTTQVSSAASYPFTPAGDVTLTAKFALSPPAPVIFPAGGLTKTYDKETAILSVENTSAYLSKWNPTYQWYKDGSAIEGANGSTYPVKDVSDSGAYKVAVTVTEDGKSATATSDEISVSISAKDASALTVKFADPAADHICNGEAHEPEIVVIDGETVVSSDSYTVTYGNNVNVSTEGSPATVTASFRGNYAGEKQLTFEIRQLPSRMKVATIGDIEVNKEFTIEAALTDEAGNPLAEKGILIFVNDVLLTNVPKTDSAGKVTIVYTPRDAVAKAIKAVYLPSSNPSDTYAGSEDMIRVEVIPAQSVLALETDKNRYKVGEDVTISGKLEDGQGGTIEYAAIALSVNGKAVEAEPPVMTDEKGEFSHTIKTDAVGRFTVKAEFAGIGLAIGGSTAEASFEVFKPVIVNADITLHYGDTYTMAVATDPEGLDVEFIPTNDGVVSVDENGVVTALKPGVTTITVRCVNGTPLDEVTVTVTVVPRPISEAFFTALPTEEKTYDGTARTQAITSSLLREGTDYDVEYTDNTNTGTASYTVKGKGNYTGTITKQFTVKKADPKVSGVSVTAPATVYDSTAIGDIVLGFTSNPAGGSIKLDDGQTLTAGTKDYNWTYTPADTDNYNTVTGTVPITVQLPNVTVEVTSDYDGGMSTYVKDPDTGEIIKKTYLGDIVTYMITVRSTGKDPASNIEVNVTLPDELEHIMGDLQQSIALLKPNESHTVAILLRINEMPAAGGSIDVAATAQCDGMQEAASATNKVKVKYCIFTSAEPAEGGSISAPLLGVEGPQTITYAPNPGYRLAGLMLDGKALSVSDYRDGYPFAEISKDHFFTAEFAEAYDLTDVSVQQSETLTYSGQGQRANVTASATAVNNEAVTFTYSAEQNGTYTAEVPAFTDAGTHTVYYKAGAADHNDAAGSFTVTIGKAKLTLSLSIEGWTEGETAKTPALTGNTGNGSVIYEYKPKAADESAYSKAVPTASGEYTVRATVAETANHLGGEAMANFSIGAIPPAPDPVTYSNTKGDGGEWTKGSSKTLDFTFKRSVDDGKTFGLFTGIEVDGKAVDEDQYAAEAGSVVVKLSPEYLETLSVGSHTVKALFEDGSAGAGFTVAVEHKPDDQPDSSAGQNTNTDTTTKAAAASGRTTATAPKTGDESNMMRWFILICASAAVLLIATRRRMRLK